MKECQCPAPNQHVDPRRPDVCVDCGDWINPAWTLNDETMRAFFDRLAESIFPYEKGTGKLLTSKDFDAFRAQSEERERAGREKFGHSILAKDCPAEGTEEAADLSIYALGDVLQAIRAGRGHEDEDLALTAAAKVFEAHRALRQLASKRRHDTGPGWTE